MIEQLQLLANRMQDHRPETSVKICVESWAYSSKTRKTDIEVWLAHPRHPIQNRKFETLAELERFVDEYIGAPPSPVVRSEAIDETNSEPSAVPQVSGG